MSSYDGLWHPEHSIHGQEVPSPQAGDERERLHMRSVKLKLTSEPVWGEEEAREKESLQRDERPVPSLAPDAEASKIARDVYAALPDRIMVRAVAPKDSNLEYDYYLFSVPTTFYAARGIIPRRLSLQLVLADASGSIPPGIPISYEMNPGTQVATKIVNLGKLKIDLGSGLKAFWPTMPDVLTAKFGGSLDLKKVEAKVQAEGRNSQRCGWRISDTENDKNSV